MKNNNQNRKTDYSKIMRKFYLYIVIAVIVASVFVVILTIVIDRQNFVSKWIVDFLINSFHLEVQEASRIYWYTIRNNIGLFMYAAIAICFFFLCHFIFTKLMKYFDEVNAGIDSIIQAKGEQVDFSPEMAFMKQKINTLKQTLDEREQGVKLAEQRKNDIVMYLAHDIKTPLTSVIGYLSLLDESPDMPPGQKAKYLNITLEKANRLEKLVNEFFEITRYNFQTDIVSKESIDLYYMLVQMTDEFYPLLAEKGKQIVLHVPEDMTIYGDPDKLARVFNNLLKNALAHSPDNSVIDITATISDNKISIVFTNDGSIPKDKLDLVFDKFYRLDSARSSDTGGAGLGLTIAKEIVIAHNGSIYADSDGKQTSFTVELPALSLQT